MPEITTAVAPTPPCCTEVSNRERCFCRSASTMGVESASCTTSMIVRRAALLVARSVARLSASSLPMWSLCTTSIFLNRFTSIYIIAESCLGWKIGRTERPVIVFGMRFESSSCPLLSQVWCVAECHASQIFVLPDNWYTLIFLIFFRRDVNLKSLDIVTAKENQES